MITHISKVIAQIGYMEHGFKAANICNSCFMSMNMNVMIAPFSCKPEHKSDFLKQLLMMNNVLGVLVSVPHKLTTFNLVDKCSRRARVAQACNVVRLLPNAQLEGDIFDGVGLVQALKRHGFIAKDKTALVIGCGSVGAAVAAALAEMGIGSLRLYDTDVDRVRALAWRLRRYFLGLKVVTGINDGYGMDLIVNATLIGMNENEAFPTAVARISPNAWVCEAILKSSQTPFLRAVKQVGCYTINAMETMIEQLPMYLDFFGLNIQNKEKIFNLGQKLVYHVDEVEQQQCHNISKKIKNVSATNDDMEDLQYAVYGKR